MTMSLLTAQAHMTALLGLLNGAQSDQAFLGYCFRKHVSKRTATEWAAKDKQDKSYFKAVTDTIIPSLADYKAIKNKAKVMGLGKKVESNHFGLNNKTGKMKNVHYMKTKELDPLQYGAFIISICNSPGTFHAAGDPDRFFYLVPLPTGYVGRTVSKLGTKVPGAYTHAKLLITDSPQIMSVMAADATEVAQLNRYTLT